MGWSGGTELFDGMVEAILEYDEETAINLITPLLDLLESKDWDNVCESEYFEHPIVRRVIEAKHDGWYDDEDDE